MQPTETGQGSTEREESVRLVSENAEVVLRNELGRARLLRFSDPGFDRNRLTEFCELGWVTLRLPENEGGLGLGVSELAAVSHQLGRSLVPEPAPSLAIVAPYLPPTLRDKTISGAAVVLPAFAAFDTASPVIGSNGLSGRVDPVHYGLGADAFLVQTADGAALVDANQTGVVASRQSTHDGGHLLDIRFEQVSAKPIEVDMRSLRDEAVLVQSAYLLGVAEMAFEITKAYLIDRKQFGQQIGAFQALQHKMVDLYLELSLIAAAVEAACDAWDDGKPAQVRAKAVSQAKARAVRGAHSITQSSIQLHGGIGYTDEANIGLFLRKTMTVAGLLGSERFHRQRAFQITEKV